ncbi:MAG: glutamine-hydrolyzing GMP synthase, partial [bacterium]
MKRPKDFVAILDFGAQYSLLIARTVREAKVYSEVFPYNIRLADLKKLKPRGIILSGGPDSVYAKGAPHSDPGIYKLDVPVLGICYGMQLMGYQLGGKVKQMGKGEYGRAEIHQIQSSELFGDLNPDLIGWMSHGDIVEEVPAGFENYAVTDQIPSAAMGHASR